MEGSDEISPSIFKEMVIFFKMLSSFEKKGEIDIILVHLKLS